jgi:hypothetical protein
VFCDKDTKTVFSLQELAVFGRGEMAELKTITVRCKDILRY